MLRKRGTVQPMGKSTRNLWSHFAPLGVEPEEVFMALRWLTGGTAKPEGARTVVGHPGRFLVGTTNRGRPKIEPLAPMSESQVDDLVRKCADLLAGSPGWTTFAVFGQFSSDVAAAGCDGLQVRTIDDLNLSPLTTMPPSSGVSEHPLQPALRAALVDVRFTRAGDGFVSAARRDRAARHAGNLVTLASWPTVRRPTAMPETWNVVWDGATGELRNARLYPGFHHAEIRDSDERPLAVRHSLPTVAHADLAAGRLFDLPAALYLSDSLGTLWTNLQSLDTADRRKADRALSWFALAEHEQDRSRAITSLATAVEALLPGEPSSFCPECRQPVLGISKRFKRFLDQFAGVELGKAFRDEVYAVRSRIAHGAQLY